MPQEASGLSGRTLPLPDPSSGFLSDFGRFGGTLRLLLLVKGVLTTFWTAAERKSEKCAKCLLLSKLPDKLLVTVTVFEKNVKILLMLILDMIFLTCRVCKGRRG